MAPCSDLCLFEPSVIGRRADGTPIYVAAGGARNTMEDWLPVEYSSEVITKVMQTSAMEAVAQRIPMSTRTRSTPRSAGMDVEIVGKGSPYGEDDSTNDDVILVADKFGKMLRLAEEDLDDSLANIIDVKAGDWATSYAKALDNACIAVTAAKAQSGCAFDSLYYLLTQAEAGVGYGANDNLTKTGSGGTTYALLSETLRKVEVSDYFDDANATWIMHPAFKDKLRQIVDNQGRPIFNESSGGGAGGAFAVPDRVMSYPVRWSLGARTSPLVTSRPLGNPLAVFCIPNYLLLGVRSGPETIFIDGRNGASAATDESLLKIRARRGFAVGIQHAFSILEDNS